MKPSSFDASDKSPPTSQASVLQYHARTIHHLNRYAAAPGYMDWANQPDPFRRFQGAPLIPLSLNAGRVLTGFHAMHGAVEVPICPLDAGSVGAFLELSFGLSAWKRAGESAWALRCNPSSGNLHPTECYILSANVSGIPNGLHHYAPREHALELRAHSSLPLPNGVFLLGLSSIHWREAWKYGERAWRYCQHDVGHAIASAAYAAATLGWSARILASPSDADVAALLGLDRAADFEDAEPEYPDVLMVIGRPGVEDPEIDHLLAAHQAADWLGTANRLSAEHVNWSVIDSVTSDSMKPHTQEQEGWAPSEPHHLGVAEDVPAARIIRQRRSAQAFDPRASLPRGAFMRILARLLPRRANPPWSVLPWAPLVHPVLVVHRIEGLMPGLYALPRSNPARDLLQDNLNEDFNWTAISNHHGVPLYLLREGDGQNVAKTVSCHQDIASDGVFTLGMLADFRPILEGLGDWWYRRLFWEAGVLGQCLYLEAEAAGIRGTGIGCYFDDVFHEVLGCRDTTVQSVYHFTVGMPLEDTRLQTLPPYVHLPGNRVRKIDSLCEESL